MGSLFDCFRGSNTEQTRHSNDVTTPDTEARRQAAAEAANRRLEQNERRGVDEDELRRMKKRQADRERIEQQQAKLPKQTDNGDGLRYISRPFWPYEYEHRLNLPNSPIRELNPIRLSPTVLHNNPRYPSTYSAQSIPRS